MRYASMLLLFLVLSAGAERSYSQSCPVVTVACPDFNNGPTLTFSANIMTGDPSAKLTFNWTVSAGKIASGQGTASIIVDKSGGGGQSFTATVEVGGLPKSCGNQASCSVLPPCPAPTARKFDQYGDLTWAEERARLDKFAGHLEPGIRLSKALHHRRSSHRRGMHRSNKSSPRVSFPARTEGSTKTHEAGKSCSRDLLVSCCFV
jgi:hypothetical protein